MLFAHTPIARLARRLWADRASMQRERLINTRPKRDLCKQEQLEVGAAKWERGSFGAKFLSAPFEERAWVLLRFLLRLF